VKRMDYRDWVPVGRFGALVCLAIIGVCLTAAQRVGAHGSLEEPPSRTFACRFHDVDNAMCEEAWADDPQALYDWMEVNLADVAGRHREWIPDGTLCGAGREKYAAFDLPGAWPARTLVPAADGLYPVRFYATAPHAAQSFRFYLSREGFDPLVERLDWDDLEPVYDSGPVAVEALVAAPHYTFRLPLPDRAGRAILYFVWQRSDSPEAFYGCSDVILGAAGSPEPGDPSEAPTPTPTPTPTPPSEPSLPGPGLEDLAVVVDLYEDWGTGACGEGIVTNAGAASVVWEVNLSVDGTLGQLWDAERHDSTHPHEGHSAMPHPWRIVGAHWNRTLGPEESTTFGFCLDRTPREGPGEGPPSQPPVTEEPAVSVSVGGQHWRGGFTAALVVSNETDVALENWTFRFRSTHRVSGSPWGITIETTPLDGGLYEHTVTGADWARQIPVGGQVYVGFNGSQGDRIGNAGPLGAADLFDGEGPGE